MKIFEGKSPAEKNKMIIAGVLGVLALGSLIYTFSGMFTGGKKVTVNVTASPTPTVAANTTVPTGELQMPSREQINADWLTTPVVYNPSSFYAPDAGRNIFAFYEPPAPTPYVPPPPGPVRTPTPFVETPVTPVPTPTPNLIIGYITPQTVYAGSKGFRLEVNGEGFTPETVIYFSGVQLPTNFVGPQKVTADIPANLIAGEGSREIEVRTPDGKLFSARLQLNVQQAPRPQFQYIGLIARRNYNNDTAYFQETGKAATQPFGARLNDVVAGRFRVLSISSSEVILEDTTLGFRYKLPLLRPEPGQTASTGTGAPVQNNVPPGFPPNTNFEVYTQQIPAQLPPGTQQQSIPGIPANVQPYVPPQQRQPPPRPPVPNNNDDEDDEDGRP